ncbi:MAG: hypothetical protein AAGN66_21790 [Acidobacteriota bacterium]
MHSPAATRNRVPPRRRRIPQTATLACLAALMALPAAAVVPPSPGAPVAAKAFQAPGLDVETGTLAVDRLDPEDGRRARGDLAHLGAAAGRARLDTRGGRWSSLWLHRPLMPGAGAANRLAWTDLGLDRRPDDATLADLAWEGFWGFVTGHADVLRIEPRQLRRSVGVHAGGDLIQIHARREVDGIPVRGAGLTATVNHGNLVLLGADRWGDVTLDTHPTLDSEAALGAALAFLDPHRPRDLRTEPRLEILPRATAQDDRYRHHLAWIFPLRFDGAVERFEVAVDAHSGEILAMEDTNHYHRNVHGGAYPISNDGQSPDGVEIPGVPMPFADVTHSGGTATTDAGGNVEGITGAMTTALEGPYWRVDDGCGAVSETSTAGDLDLGISGGTDCTTPPGASAGNTHAARTAFYELNRIAAGGRAQLPANPWLQGQVRVRLNDSVTCNAFWTGTNLLFYRSQSTCANLGELAGVLDHEWGHGMDDNGTNGSVSSPGEGIADVYAALRINSSCPGRGALPNVCSGFGDPCIAAFGCTAARDIDWERHESQQPHDVAWVNANCGSSRHCRGHLTSESIWDLYKRDLPARYGMDNNTALEVATRLTYLGADNVASWFTTANGEEGGCAASSGYQQFLAADDDNGDLTDGTPHMQAIFDAFDRHGIACPTPAVQDSGCAGAPTVAPAVTIQPGDRGAQLSWNAVAGATRYKVFRTDGVFQCDFGKEIVAATPGTTFADTGLQDGRDYYYVVAGFGPSDACMGPTSPCATVVPGVASEIFADAFEGGDLLAWSSVVVD